MYLINTDIEDPSLNLALEEFLLKNSAEEYLILSINSTSVIAGKHQCLHREINTKYITDNDIPVLRRISGGGAVFHDKGNLNFCFIKNCEPGRQIDFNRHLIPVTEFLASLGVTVNIEGSDLKVNGYKISGNAEHVYRNRVLHHGTLLWNASLDTLRNCLRKDTAPYKTRAVASRPSTVTNLSEIITNITGINGFKNAMFEYFREKYKGKRNDLAEEHIDKARALSEKYHTWEWNYAYGPEYEFSSDFIYRNRKLRCILKVSHGIIEESNIDGNSDLDRLCEKLKGCRHMPEDVGHILTGLEIEIDKYNFF